MSVIVEFYTHAQEWLPLPFLAIHMWTLPYLNILTKKKKKVYTTAAGLYQKDESESAIILNLKLAEKS